MKREIKQLGHQKTTLTSGFDVTVGYKLTASPVVKKCYHNLMLLSNLEDQKRPRGADGIRTRNYYWRGSRFAVNLPPRITEARTVLQENLFIVNSGTNV